MAGCGLLELLLPELAAGAGVEQRSLHCFDVLEHSLRSCDAADPDNLPVRLAALLHDIGKPGTLRARGGRHSELPRARAPFRGAGLRRC